MVVNKAPKQLHIGRLGLEENIVWPICPGAVAVNDTPALKLDPRQIRKKFCGSFVDNLLHVQLRIISICTTNATVA